MFVTEVLFKHLVAIVAIHVVYTQVAVHKHNHREKPLIFLQCGTQNHPQVGLVYSMYEVSTSVGVKYMFSSD